MNLANLSIAKRLAIGFGTVAVLLVGSQTFGINMVQRVSAGATELADRRIPNLMASNEVLSEVNDVAIALRNMVIFADPADRQQQIDEVLSSRRAVQGLLERMDKTVVSSEGRALLERMRTAHDKYIAGQEQMIKLVNAGDQEAVQAHLKTVMRPILVELKTVVNDQVLVQKKFTAETAASVHAAEASTRLWMTLLALASLAMAVLVAWWNTRSITRPMARALEVANTVAAGDLTSRIEVTSTDETGKLLQALKTMNENLVRTVTTVRTGTETIGTAASEVAAGSLDLSSRTEQQAGSLEETASSMEELTSTVKQNADNARQANMLAEAASTVAARGGQVIGEVVGTMERINGSAGKIADIIGVIDGIAFQTNILALNAAVEAARAGEQGRGFAVVASEVRNLAQRSAAAAKEIKGLIGDSTEAVQAGSKLVSEAGATMTEIVDSVRRVTDIMGEITSASVEQTAGIEQINEAIAQMDQVTQQNAALVEEAAAASASMQEQAASLARAVSVFRVEGMEAAAVASVASAPVAVAAPVRPALAKPESAKPAAKPAAKPSAKPAPARKGAAKPTAKVDAEGDWEEF